MDYFTIKLMVYNLIIQNNKFKYSITTTNEMKYVPILGTGYDRALKWINTRKTLILMYLSKSKYLLCINIVFYK